MILNIFLILLTAIVVILFADMTNRFPIILRIISIFKKNKNLKIYKEVYIGHLNDKINFTSKEFNLNYEYSYFFGHLYIKITFKEFNTKYKYYRDMSLNKYEYKILNSIPDNYTISSENNLTDNPMLNEVIDIFYIAIDDINKEINVNYKNDKNLYEAIQYLNKKED